MLTALYISISGNTSMAAMYSKKWKRLTFNLCCSKLKDLKNLKSRSIPTIKNDSTAAIVAMLSAEKDNITIIGRRQMPIILLIKNKTNV